jgi:hypothetical protein
MEVHQLRAALSQDDAEPSAVLDRLYAKRRARHRRRLTLTAAVAVAGVAVATGWFAVGGEDGSSPTRAVGSASAGVGPGPTSAATQPGGAGAEGCADTPLADRLRELRGSGASVVVARGVLTGRTGRDGYLNHEMALNDVRTLSGPAVRDGTLVWVETPELPPLPDPIARRNPGPLWGPGGALFGIVLPQGLTGSLLGATIVQTPVVDDQIIFGTSGGCWSTRGLDGKPFQGALTEIPGSNTYARASVAGFTAVPLSTVEQLASHA